MGKVFPFLPKCLLIYIFSREYELTGNLKGIIYLFPIQFVSNALHAQRVLIGILIYEGAQANNPATLSGDE